MAAPAIRFMELAGDDFPLLHDWLNRPHLRRFFQKTPISLDGVHEKYDPRLSGDTATRCQLAWLDAPFGYLQCYRIADFPDWGEMIGQDEGIGVDLYIGEPDLIGIGLGAAMLRAYLAQVAFPLFPEARTAWITHEADNLAAQGCSRSVGFQRQGVFLESGLKTILYGLERETLS
jgi:aminoglycoside 6'-N-acetyltransferase